jgi:hypothetical protein
MEVDKFTAKIVIDNEDDAYNTFVKILMTESMIEGLTELRCKKAVPIVTQTSTIKKFEPLFSAYEG